MDSYWYDWLNFVVRFLHLITGIAWIGASFYFVWLDNSIRTPPQWKQDMGIKGDLWAVHGGGFYEVAKYTLGPKQIPETLHWFKWEAYYTGITGFILLVLVYYVGAHSYLIDPNKAELSASTAILLSLGAIVLGFIIYESLCRTPLVDHGLYFGLAIWAVLTIIAWSLYQVFSDRAAYIHVGAIMGICMVLNVFTVIMPSQRKMVADVTAGRVPDAQLGYRAKLRSVHNNYATLPVLFIMISNHYPVAYANQNGWLILAALIGITAWVRHFFNLRHHHILDYRVIGSAIALFLLLIWLVKPAPLSQDGVGQVTTEGAVRIVQMRCMACHSASPTDDVFKVAQAGIMYDSEQQIVNLAPRIFARAVQNKDMPLLNKTQMTDAERAYLAAWVEGLK